MNYDLIVVGTSFASTFFLKKYLEKSPDSVKVLVLERGKFEPHAERISRAKKMALGEVGFISGTSSGAYENNNPAKPWIFDPSFGGNSNCWTGCTPRFMPSDFELKTRFGVGIDWPISYADLEPYMCEAEEIMSIAGPANTPYPMSRPYPLPPHQVTAADKLLEKRYAEYYISQPTARASKPGARNACCNSSICHLCPVSAKFTIENGLHDVYKDPRITLQFETQVLSLDVAGGLVTGVNAEQRGEQITLKGSAVALGANAIFNAHILLNSGDDNTHTGRHLSEQVGYYGYVHLDGLDNVGGSTIITANGFMLYDLPSRKDAAACLIESHNDPYVRSEHGKWRQIMKLKFVFEDIPQAGNRVTTSSDLRTPRVEYEGHSQYVNNGYTLMKSKIAEVLSPLPVEEILIDENAQASEAHILGTTRMSMSKADGVIDKHLIHHTFRNVFVLGGGSFPTISAANPTLTLSALSLWSADKIF
ncbi:MAG: GMC family oxidoreductase [Cyclobacteriaceae bacterium]|nr:GMC family oxidoreductase [Cyclobacteriaceae bacterium]